MKFFKSEPESKRVPLSSLKVDDAIYPRSSVDQERVKEFAELLQEGVRFDPIVATKSTTVDQRTNEKMHVVLDGIHRLEAHKLAGLSEIDAVEVDEPPSVLYAAMHNARHGKPLTGEEKRDVARRIVTAFPDYDLSDLAEKLGASVQSARRWTQEIREGAHAEVKERMEELRSEGKSQQEVAEEVGVSQQTVSRVLTQNEQVSETSKQADELSGLLAKGERLEKVAQELGTSVAEAEDLLARYLETEQPKTIARIAEAEGKRIAEDVVKRTEDTLEKRTGASREGLKAASTSALLLTLSKKLAFECPDHGREGLKFECGLSLEEAARKWKV